ncbi:MAG TPA: hypothetical protein VFV99_07150 [Kofleriaceae bacterium]|nr:hypothetical protein [Kofleriaceae bacterium]
MKTWIICALFLATASHVRAEGTEIDVRSFEFLDVIETADGNVWKGVVIEQTPNVSYKIALAGGSIHVIPAADVQRMSKQRNGDFKNPRASAVREDGVEQSYEPAAKLPAPYARSGLRVDPELSIVFPTGYYDHAGVQTSFAPGMRVGFESLFGNIGVSGGGQARFTYWRLPGPTKDAAWLLETQLYGRAAVHIGRATPYIGLALGIDTNYVYSYALDDSVTGVGLGMNLSTGLQLAVSPLVGVEIGGDYHPATDTISDMSEDSVSYFALRLGATVRL